LKSIRKYFFTVAVLLFIARQATPIGKAITDGFRSVIDLSGTWQFSIDNNYQGMVQKWFLNELNDHIQLPGTMDTNRKGFLNKATTTMHLNRVYKYEGAAWYRQEVWIPQNWRDEHIQLEMVFNYQSQ
jgi:hypothetical protein